MSVHWPILRRLAARPGATIITDDRKTWRAVEILVGSMHVAREVRKVNRTQTLGVMLPTSGAFPMAALAAWSMGRTLVPLNYLLKPEELQYVVDDCGTDTIITAKPMLEYLQTSGGWGEGGKPKVKNLLLLDEMPFKGVPSLRPPSLRGSFGSKDELAVLLYTSGTSGKPKGVMLSHHNLASNVRQTIAWADFTHKDVILGVLPQFHSFGLTVLTLLPLTRGCRIIYSARFIPAQIVKLFREHRPTAFVGIPSMYNALLSSKDAKKEDFASLRFAVSGGEALPGAVFERFQERFGVTINEGYGLTETAPVTNWCRPHEFKRKSVGRALSGVEERIVDPETGKTLGPNEDGEIRIKGPNVMKGYYNLPEETQSVFDDQGYFRTGDMGRFDDDGHLYITGRIKEMLIIGGENVFPREIEEVLDRHPAVKASGVVGKPDDVRGELPVAFVELKEGEEATPSELRSWCRENLAGYKVPREIRVVDELPRNPTGKVMRRELRTIIDKEQKEEAND
ncbi:MAG: long-chain fatty acid--CoA ligase [Phycisphaerales bacterium]|nr:MAG: long-chain fatty acid--CoA ligase [Phycisphaerales bacterium]